MCQGAPHLYKYNKRRRKNKNDEDKPKTHKYPLQISITPLFNIWPLHKCTQKTPNLLIYQYILSEENRNLKRIENKPWTWTAEILMAPSITPGRIPKPCNIPDINIQNYPYSINQRKKIMEVICMYHHESIQVEWNHHTNEPISYR